MSGEQVKQLGLDLVESHNPDFVALARAEARRLCIRNGSVSADDLRGWSNDNGIHPGHPNAWGSVFRTGFMRVGYRQSVWPASHARVISVWELKKKSPG